METEDWNKHSDGAVWTTASLARLDNLWINGVAFDDIARDLGRTRLSIAYKMKHSLVARSDHIDETKSKTWYNPNVRNHNTSFLPTPQPKPMENIMSKFTEIKNTESVLANLYKTLTLDDYIAEIAKHEACMVQLKALENKPKAVVAKIKSHQDIITNLIKACDEQFCEDK